ncbi:MAG TPA: hypothetical protein VHB68_16475 [Steroidobacteraceae bacterium]|nr:hypothetical protein [Steroidobacteraceae bacterium]
MSSVLLSDTADRGDATFRWIVLVVQTFFGSWFLVHGLNYFVTFFRQPPGASVLSHELIGALIATGLFAWVKVVEVVVGILLLAHRFVPLAIVAALPVTLVIAYVNLALNKDLFGLITGTVIIAANVLMAVGYLDSYRAMMRFDAGLPGLRGLRSLRGGA